MSPSHQAKSRFLDQLSTRIFEQMIRGEYDFERDNQQLQSYIEQARQMDDIALEAKITKNLAILHDVAGDYMDAEAILWNSFHLSEQIHDKAGMAFALGTMANSKEKRAHYDQALALQDQAIAYLDKTADPSIYRFLISNRMYVLCQLKRYDEVDKAFEEIQSIFNHIDSAERDAFARHMVYSYQIMAERELVRDDVESAQRYLNLAKELAIPLALKFEMAEIHATQAHILIQHDNDWASAENEWAQMKMLYMQIPSPSQVGWYFTKEADYLLQRGHTEKAHEFAQTAFETFDQHGLHTECERAKVLLRFN